MNLYASENANLVKNHDVLLKLQERGYVIEPIYNKYIERFDENLIGVDELLCYILPIDNTPRILSDTILTDTDFIIACSKYNYNLNYYIIPSDDIIQSKRHYPIEYEMYKDKWELLNL